MWMPPPDVGTKCAVMSEEGDLTRGYVIGYPMDLYMNTMIPGNPSTTLKAIDENPNSKILITGIGMAGGKQYYHNYNYERTNYQGRARVDRFLIKRLKKKFLKNIYTTDEELFNYGNIKLWKL